MARSLFSASWHQVAELKPRLSPQARISRHVYRGQVWFVLQDQAGGRHHRLTPAAYQLVNQMDGQTTVKSLWENANQDGSGDAFTQNEMVDLLVQLHGSDVLQTDVSPDSAALLERYRKKKRETLRQWLLNPMSIKIPLYNPDPLLAAWAPYVRGVLSPWGAVLWLLVVVPALVLAGQNWSALTANLSDRVLSSSNLLVMLAVYPVVKLLHELGHGLVTRVYGGPVPQLGLMFMMFAPVPYVEASSASAFPSKYRRALVGAAGMLVEVFVAALAMYVWVLSEPGVARAVAYNTLIIAGVSTLVVNGNPLLKYDAYFILADLIEMPNLAQRGQKYMAYLWDRYVFKATDLPIPSETPSERRWLVMYTPLAWCYRTFVSVSMILFVGTQYFIFGVLLALWSAFTLVCVPLWKGYRHVVAAPQLHHHRQFAVRVTALLVAGLLMGLFVVPMPLRTQSEGVIWLPDQALVHTAEAGFFKQWQVEPGVDVKPGIPLFLLENPQLRGELQVARARVDEYKARYAAEQFADPVKAGVTLRQLEHEQAQLRQLEVRYANLGGAAQSTGKLLVQTPQDMPGKHYRKGELIGYVLGPHAALVRVVVSQDDIGLVRSRLKGVELRLAEDVPVAMEVKVLREVPGGQDELPSPALGLSGGGQIATQPSDNQGVKTLQRVFVLDLQLPRDMVPRTFGERVHVRFNHGVEPLAFQWGRRLRQLFLSHFNV